MPGPSPIIIDEMMTGDGRPRVSSADERERGRGNRLRGDAELGEGGLDLLAVAARVLLEELAQLGGGHRAQRAVVPLELPADDQPPAVLEVDDDGRRVADVDLVHAGVRRHSHVVAAPHRVAHHDAAAAVEHVVFVTTFGRRDGVHDDDRTTGYGDPSVAPGDVREFAKNRLAHVFLQGVKGPSLTTREVVVTDGRPR